MIQVFSPAQAKSVGEQRIAKDALRAKGLAEITDEVLKEKKDAEEAFAFSMKRQQQEADEWFKNNLKEKQALTEEVERLEQRRKDALSPLLIKEEDIHSVQEALNARELTVQQQEIENGEVARTLMRKIDAVQDQQQSLDEREKRVVRQEQGAEFQKNQIIKDAKRLTVQLSEFEARMSLKETEIAYKQSELDARTNLIEEKEKGFFTREQEVQAAMRLLTDQRILLEKGFKELRLKQK